MGRRLQNILLALLICLCLVNLLVVQFIFSRYKHDAEKVKDLEYRLLQWERKVDLSDRWETRNIYHRISSNTHQEAPPKSDYHLIISTNGAQRFELSVIKSIGRPAGAWVSIWKPHAEMLKFEDFHVAPNPETGKIELSVTPRIGETIDMEFTVTVLEQHFKQ
jgi:hypothetical protein